MLLRQDVRILTVSAKAPMSAPDSVLFRFLLLFIALQIKQQLADITDDYRRLQSTALVNDSDITLQDLVWASDMITSRSFVYPKQEGVPHQICCANIPDVSCGIRLHGDLNSQNLVYRHTRACLAVLACFAQ